MPMGRAAAAAKRYFKTLKVNLRNEEDVVVGGMLQVKGYMTKQKKCFNECIFIIPPFNAIEEEDGLKREGLLLRSFVTYKMVVLHPTRGHRGATTVKK